MRTHQGATVPLAPKSVAFAADPLKSSGRRIKRLEQPLQGKPVGQVLSSCCAALFEKVHLPLPPDPQQVQRRFKLGVPL